MDAAWGLHQHAFFLSGFLWVQYFVLSIKLVLSYHTIFVFIRVPLERWVWIQPVWFEGDPISSHPVRPPVIHWSFASGKQRVTHIGCGTGSSLHQLLPFTCYVYCTEYRWGINILVVWTSTKPIPILRTFSFFLFPLCILLKRMFDLYTNLWSNTHFVELHCCIWLSRSLYLDFEC